MAQAGCAATPEQWRAPPGGRTAPVGIFTATDPAQTQCGGADGANPSSAAVLFEAALASGQTATAQPLGGLEVGLRADFLVLDVHAPALLGVPSEHVLDALVFSSPQARFTDVFVAGRQVVSGGRIGNGTAGLASWQQVTQDYVRTMQQLWG